MRKLLCRSLPANIAVLALALIFLAGCRVRVNEADGGKDVKIATPFGSIAVNQNQTSAGDVGLPPYPGANLVTGHDGNQSAKVDLGFGSWKLRVRVAHYVTQDNGEKVLAFYRKALSEYGGVIECRGKRPVGSPGKTGEGLTCEDSDEHGTPHGNVDADDIQLKAGSPRHQHLVILKSEQTAPTDFTLIALDLPHGNHEQQGTN
jgi:hypothetical protein